MQYGYHSKIVIVVSTCEMSVFPKRPKENMFIYYVISSSVKFVHEKNYVNYIYIQKETGHAVNLFNYTQFSKFSPKMNMCILSFLLKPILISVVILLMLYLNW